MLRRSIAGLVFALTVVRRARPRADLCAVRRRFGTGPVLQQHPVDVQPRHHARLRGESAIALRSSCAAIRWPRS